MSLEDKVVVVTGASGGIGRALAIELHRRGATVVLVARRRKELEALQGELGSRATVAVGDVTKRAEVEAALATAVSAYGHVDVWVNNAGRGISVNPEALTDDDLDTMITDNVKSALYGMQASLKHFRSRGTGQIVNVSSMLSRTPYVAIRSAYSAAKAALNSLTESLRVQIRESAPGVVVTLVLPGPVATDFGSNARGGGPDSRALAGAQTAEEVAVVIADAIRDRKREVYTHPSYAGRVAEYFAKLQS